MEKTVNTEKENLDKTDESKEISKKYVKQLIDNIVKKNLENFNKKKTILCNDPLIYTLDDYLTNEECDNFINLSKNKLQRAKVSDGKKDGGVVSKHRTGSNCWISHNFDEKTENFGKRIAKEVDHPLKNAEKFQIIYYGETQEYRRHYDSWDHDYSEKSLKCVKYGGFRLLTALCYLNDVEEGGGTDFPRLNLTVEAKKGRIVVFENTLKNTNKKHPLSEHAGMPVLKGEKYAINLWFREHPVNMLYKKFNPEYYKIGEPIVRKRIEEQLKKSNKNIKSNNEVKDILKYYKLKNFIPTEFETLGDIKYNIKFKNDFISDEIKKNILSKVGLDEEKEKEAHWVQTNELPELNKKIEKLTGIESKFYEGYNLIKYTANETHNNFFDGWNLTNETEKKHIGTQGQRLYSVVLFFTENIEYNFSALNLTHVGKENSILMYKNVVFNSNQLNFNLLKTIKNKNSKSGILLNLYIREKSTSGVCLFNEEKYLDIEFSQNIKLKVTEKNDN